MIEYGDVEERKVAGYHGRHRADVWVRVGESGEKIFAITNEDMERTRDERPLFTSCASSWARMKWLPSNPVSRFLWYRSRLTVRHI